MNNTNNDLISNLSSNAKYYVKGAIAGMAGILFSHPVDTIKTHIQTGNALRTLKPGITSLYRGLSAPLLGVGIEKAIVFGTYNNMLCQFNNGNREFNLQAIAVSGAIAGLTATIVVTPYERIKILKQYHNGSSFSFEKILMKPSFLFRGFSATFTREVPGFAIYFSVYESLKHHYHSKHGREIGYLHAFLYGGIAGVSAWIFIYPQDRIKTILQSSNSNILNNRGAFLNVIHDIYKKGGLKHFYSGFSWAVMRAILLHSGTFSMMEILNR